MMSFVSAHGLVAVTALFFSIARTTHFRGFTMNVQPVGRPGNDSGTVRLTFRVSWRGTSADGMCTSAAVRSQDLHGSPVRFRCLTNNCRLPLLPFTMEYVCTSFSETDNWSSGTNEIAHSFLFSRGKEFVVGNDFNGTNDCCRIATNNDLGKDILFQARFSFELRSNNASVINHGKANHSPVTDVVPILRLALGCDSKTVIAKFDPDGDDVKCRWALSHANLSRDECGSACFENNSPNDVFNTTLLEDECALKWTPFKSGFYTVAIQLEDFYPTDLARTSPLSSIPLQWLINVVDTGAPCWSRPIFPKQIHIPRDQPRCFAVSTGENLNLHILTEHPDFPYHKTVEVVYAAPRGLLASDLEDWDFESKRVTFTWSPDMDQGNGSYVMCFQFFDDTRMPSSQVCFAIVTSIEQPKPFLHTANTTTSILISGEFAHRVVASIKFDQDVRNPAVGPRYIFVYHLESGALIHQIDSFNKGLVRIGADSRTVIFDLYAHWQGGEYEIMFEEGVVVGASAFCSGGGPVARGVFAGEWTFVMLPDCLSTNVTCNASSICIRTWEGVSCQCSTEQEDGITRCDDVDECSSHVHNCHKHATCTDTLPSFTCACRIGFFGNGVLCEDINECAVGLDDCQQHFTCQNTLGSFVCACTVGYAVDGFTCVDVNECLEPFHNCDVNAYCENTLGSFTCTCQSGFSGDGIVCRDIDECASGLDNCHKSTDCNNTLGSFVCICGNGFSGDGVGACADVNECNEDLQCDNVTHRCINTYGGYECACKEGYSIDSVATTALSQLVCQQWGICSNVTGTLVCKCLSGLTRSGEICTDVDECSASESNNCHQFANCSNTFRSYNCQCIDGYLGNGNYCEVLSSPSFPVATSVAVIVSVFILVLLFVAGVCIYRRRQNHFSPAEVSFDLVEVSDSWEKNCGDLMMLEEIGKGFFGMVFKAKLYQSAHRLSKLQKRSSEATVTVVACKVLKETYDQNAEADFLEEIKLMKEIGRHQHIVSMLGCVTQSQPFCLLLEFCCRGNLLDYLRKSRTQHSSVVQSEKVQKALEDTNETGRTVADSEENKAEVRYVNEMALENVQVATLDEGKSKVTPQTDFTALDLLSFTWQISSGMEYLTGKGVVHRDVACRNVLVGEGNLLKVSDFGLARAVYQDGIYSHKRARRLPFRWMSVEAIQRRVFSQQTDVWSFGVVMWEIFTLGNFPYPCVSSRSLLQYLAKGNRLSCPGNCSEELYTTMLNCWNADPEKRPTFGHLSETLGIMLEEQNPSKYLDLEAPFWELKLAMESEESGSDSVEEGNLSEPSV